MPTKLLVASRVLTGTANRAFKKVLFGMLFMAVVASAITTTIVILAFKTL